MEKHNIQLNYHSHAIDNKIIHNGCTLAQIWYRKPYQTFNGPIIVKNLQYRPFESHLAGEPLKSCRNREITYTYVYLSMTKALQGGV